MGKYSEEIRVMNHYYELNVNIERTDYKVYYRSPVDYSLENVPKYAVRDGDLIDTDSRYVDKIRKITSEEYHKYMWE